MKITSILGLITSAFLIIIILALITLSFFEIISSVKIKTNFECKKIIHPISERNIILRLDDVQAFIWRETQIKIVEDTLAQNKTMVLGIIPGISYKILEDAEIFNLLQKNKCKTEIALHGYEHTYKEFENLTLAEAEEKISKGLKILNKIEKNIITFIPPDNAISNKTFLILKQHNIKFISSDKEEGEYGFTASTYDWKNKKLEPLQNVLNKCKNALDKTGLCIIMIHPQDYINENGKLDTEKYKEYLTLLDSLDALNAKTITFRDIFLNQSIIIN